MFATGLSLRSISGVIDRKDLADRLAAGVDEIDAVIADLRSSIFGLYRRPGEAASIWDEVNRILAGATGPLGATPRLVVEGPVETLLPEQAVPHLFAVLTEALSNVAKHAQASTAEVHLRGDADAVHLEVVDDGVGVSPTGRRSGVANMRRRARQLGGTFSVEAAPGGGTRLTWRIPTASRIPARAE